LSQPGKVPKTLFLMREKADYLGGTAVGGGPVLKVYGGITKLGLLWIGASQGVGNLNESSWFVDAGRGWEKTQK